MGTSWHGRGARGTTGRFVTAMVLLAVLTTGQVPVMGGWVAARGHSATAGSTSAGPAVPRPGGDNYASLPLRFEANRGQADGDVKFVARTREHVLHLTATEAVLSLPPAQGDGAPGRPDVVRMRLVGGNSRPMVEGREKLPGVTNYLLGNDPAKWATGVTGYGSVRYRNAYPGVDLVYYGDEEGRVEYDFVVKPGVDPGVIRLEHSGQRSLAVAANGDLVLSTSGGELRQHRPVIYQEVRGVRRPVSGRYLLDGQGVRFEVGPYNRDQPLVIDPVFSYSTYLGASGNDEPRAMATDSSGAAYITGMTTSIDFPTTGATYDKTCGTDGTCDRPTGTDPRPGSSPPVPAADVFVAKLSPDGALVYATYVGGSRDDRGVGIAVDASGNTYVAGHTDSADFPTSKNAYDRECGTDGKCNYRLTDADPTKGETKPDAFLIKLSADGSALRYSTYIGGSGNDAERGGGITYEARLGISDEPGDQRPDSSSQSVDERAFSGRHPGPAVGVAVDGSGRAYVTGSTLSPDLSTTSDAYDRSCGTDGTCNKTRFTIAYTYLIRIHPDAFLVKIDPAVGEADGTKSLLYSTYLGGSGGDVANGVAVATDGSSSVPHAFITGSTYSPISPQSHAFPTTTSSAFQPVKPTSPNHDVLAPSTPGAASQGTAPFVARLDLTAPGNSALYYSSFLGGPNGNETAYAIAVGPDGHAYVTGQAGASFPTAGADGGAPFQGQMKGSGDAFVARIDTTQERESSRVFATYLGGSQREEGRGVAVDAAGRAHVAGATFSKDFPTDSPLQAGPGSTGCVTSLLPCRDAFLAVVDGSGSSLAYSTYLHGTRYHPEGGTNDGASAVAVWNDAASDVAYTYVTGVTETNDFPTVNAEQRVNAGYRDGFVAKISPVAPVTPYVTAITPHRGNSSGASRLAIAGSSLGGATAVVFGSMPGQIVGQSDDGSGLIVVVPPGAGTVDVTVTTHHGTSPKSSMSRFAYFDGVWEETEAAPAPRDRHTATPLTGPNCGTNCGKILVVGGDVAPQSAVIYDPNLDDWTATANTVAPRPGGHTATLLSGPNCGADCGKVLVLSGDSAELFDPQNGTWAAIPSKPQGRINHTATLLEGPNCGENCGKVLFVGGSLGGAGAELYIPSTGSWSLTAPPLDLRLGFHTATLIMGQNCGTSCGQVLVVGGKQNDNQSSSSAELYDPASGRWTARANVVARHSHTATQLSSGKVLLVGGMLALRAPIGTSPVDRAINSVEVYDPSESFEMAFTAAPPLSAARSGHAAVAMPDGRALVVGGGGAFAGAQVMVRPPLSSAEIYDPNMGNGRGGWRDAGSMTTPRGAASQPAGHTAMVLGGPICQARCGKVWVFGGWSATEPVNAGMNTVTGPKLASAEQYTPGPFISGIGPVSGGAAGGDMVVIHGSGFVAESMTDPTSVTFGGSPARKFTVESPSRITAETPPAAEDANVEVAVVVAGLGRAAAPFSYAGTIGAVGDLVAEARGATEAVLTFSAIGFPPVGEYVVKQSRLPITETTFDAAQPVCEGEVCRFTPRTYREKLTVSVSGLTPETTYYYALRPKGPDGTLGPMSNVASTVTANVAPGAVTDLAATAVSEGEVRLTFSAPGSNAGDPPPARRFIVKQSDSPIADGASFEQATALCGGECILEPGAVGQGLSLSVTGLRRQTYHYALRALDDAGNVGPISNPTSVTLGCIAPAPGPGRVIYPPGYHLVGLPAGTRVPSQSVLYGWFDLGRGGRYSTQNPAQSVEGGRGYWAWFSCPRAVDLGAGSPSVNWALGGYRASMVGNPSGTAPAVVSGHDFTARWDPSANGGSGGYRVSGYQEKQILAIGEGIWAFSYRDTTLSVVAR